MKWIPLVPPRKGTQDGAGWCLRYAQSFFGAPVRYNSAWEAWQHTRYRHGPGDPLPPVPVLLWFEHWGSYGSPPSYGNWGHVAIHCPGDAIYSSPGVGYGYERFANIQQVEARFNAKYVGWSEDINGLRVAEIQSWEEEEDMTPEQSRKLDAIYDALFTTKPTSRGTRGGVLTTLRAIDDALFKTDETSFGTPGGVLATLRKVTDKLHITKPDRGESEPEA